MSIITLALLSEPLGESLRGSSTPSTPAEVYEEIKSFNVWQLRYPYISGRDRIEINGLTPGRGYVLTISTLITEVDSTQNVDFPLYISSGGTIVNSILSSSFMGNTNEWAYIIPASFKIVATSSTVCIGIPANITLGETAVTITEV